MCIKTNPQYYKGFPDRLVIMPNGLTYYVELKSSTGVLSKAQISVIDKLRINLNQRVYVITNYEQLIELVLILRGETNGI